MEWAGPTVKLQAHWLITVQSHRLAARSNTAWDGFTSLRHEALISNSEMIRNLKKMRKMRVWKLFLSH